jgi:selenocysteine-specific elongation factor
MFVIGTAGHVDHGKSTLIKALTGINPDRLKEEQIRQMTIDLGFAWLKLPDGEELGIVDVPGHRDFIENMLAGVGGIDAALFIIAADEGVMPQTREHLAIIDLLQIKNGIIVLTKIDLVDDDEWLDLVEMDVRDAMTGTILENAPLVRVSAFSQAGIDQLIHTIQEMLLNVKPKPDFDRSRLPIDRVFSLTGFGTIVTGTLMDGILQVGQEVELLPEKLKVRIRGLQTHKKNEVKAFPGSRTAVNITGVNLDQIKRGQVLATPGKYLGTQRFDAYLKIIPAANFSVKHNQTVKLFIGTSEELARVRVLGKDEIKPGEYGWVQIEPHSMIVGIRGDRFIIRIPSPGETVGGGLIVNPHPQRRYKRFSQDVIKRMEAYLQGTPKEVFLQALQDAGVDKFKEIAKKAKLEMSSIQKFWNELIEEDLCYQLEKGDVFQKPTIIICSSQKFKDIRTFTTNILTDYHQKYNLRAGIPKEELKSKLKLDQNIFVLMLELLRNQEVVRLLGNKVCEFQFSPTLTQAQEKTKKSIIEAYQSSPYSPPGMNELIEKYDEEIINYLLSCEIIISAGNDIAFLANYYQEMEKWVIQQIISTGSLTVAQFRDKFSTTRKYALSFLEHLDQKGTTMRDGDSRKLRSTR